MSRSRNIKPAFFRNEDLAELPFEYRLLFQGLWCLADREGRLEYRPKRIKAEVFPYDDVDVVKGLDALARAGFIALYPSCQVQYIQVVAFLKHQNPHCKESASTIPALCKDDAGTGNSGTSPADSLNLIPDSLKTQPEAAAPPKKSRKKSADTSLADWVMALPEAEEIISPDDPIFDWASEVGIPREWIAVAWLAFENKYGQDGAPQYANWRAVFRNAVRGDWLKLWRSGRNGGWELTTAGEMAQRERHA